ncbi:MAG: flagellar motor protein [Gammaproteobacteria bacterium]|nr:flagellar motor protein [Gammaproteobacteria bacterium]
MDALSIVGVVIALGAILGGNILEGGHTDSLIQLTAFIIVMGGTIGAVMLQTPVSVFFRSLKMLPWVVVPPKIEGDVKIVKIVEWSNLSRKDGLLALETAAEEESDPFSRKGLQLLVDGGEPEAIRNIMEIEMIQDESHDLMAAKVYEAAGGYTPTIGIIGAVMGLIHVMQNLNDPSMLGSGIAVAFVATIYGVGAANLILLPIAGKLKAIVAKQFQYKDMVLEGIIAIAEGENPRYIENKLQGYLK